MAGFPKEIFREPTIAERFLCCVCLLVFRDAVQSPCGHRYCDSCIREKLKKRSGSEYRCPACPPSSSEGVLVVDEIYPDFVARKGLRNASVKCINEGCTWTGEFQEYSQEHEAACPFEKIKCLKSGCGKTLKRVDLPHHLDKECPMRTVECKYCKKLLPYKEFKKHTAECPDVPITCSSCNKRVSRSQMDRHLNPETGDCTKRKTKCVFHSIGCTAKLVASGLEDHMVKNVVEHSQMIVNTINSTRHSKGSDGGARPMVNGLDELISKTGNAAGVADAKALDAMLKREIEKVRQDMRKLKADVEQNTAKEENTHAMIAVLDHRTETFQQVLAVLSNELEALHSKTMALERQNAYLKEFTEKQEKRLHSQDQMLTLKNIALAEQELRLQALEAISHDGVLLWRIAEIKRRKQDAAAGKTTSFYSPVFYTSAHGYKLSARVYLNGDGMGKNTHMSLFFVVMRGRHDALLSWPFQQKVTFMLLDQNNRDHIVDAFRPDPASSSFKRPASDMNIASGCPLFVTQELLSASDNFVQDDTMFIKVVVDTTALDKL